MFLTSLDEMMTYVSIGTMQVIPMLIVNAKVFPVARNKFPDMWIF